MLNVEIDNSGIDCKGNEWIKIEIGKARDITNIKYEHLLPLFRVKVLNKNKKTWWLCLCDCGKLVCASSSNLFSHNTCSCGCLTAEIQRKNFTQYDLTGQRFGKLTVIEQIVKNGNLKWRCKCDCGKETTSSSYHLRTGHSTSCGCSRTEPQVIDMTNKQCGNLLVLGPAEHKSGRAVWKCRCSCGNIIEVDGYSLRSGNTKSCGCVKSRGEQKIIQILQENNIPFKTQQKFNTCRNPKTNEQLRFDFYINNSFLLEFDGIQHYKDTNWGNFESLIERDNYKNLWCKNNNIPLKRIPYWEIDNISLKNIMDNTFLFNN